MGGVVNGFVYKNLSWRFRQNNVTRLALWAVQVLFYYYIVVVPLFVVGLVVFYPDPEYGGFFALLGALEAGGIPESSLTTVGTQIVTAARPPCSM